MFCMCMNFKVTRFTLDEGDVFVAFNSMRCGVVDRGICYEANEPIEHMYGSHRELYVYINLTPKLRATIMRYLLLTKAHIVIFTVFGTDHKFGWEYLKNYV
jgi:hypothetical protein